MMQLDKILSIPKSFLISWHFFPLRQAVKLPLLVRYNTKIGSLTGSITLGGGSSRLLIGFGGVGIFDKKYQRSMIEIDGRIELPNGHVDLGQGSKLSVGKNAYLKFGFHFHNSAELTIVCTKHIAFGDNVLVSWDTLIMDSDWHSLVNTVTDEVKPYQKDIIINDNVWIGCGCKILKGSNIAKGSVIGAGTVISGYFAEENTVIVGQSARVVRNNITRKK